MVPPAGLYYFEEFLTREEERALLDEIGQLPMAPFEMRGVQSKRLVFHFGWNYQYDHSQMTPTTPFPEYLARLRDKAAVVCGENPTILEEALVNAYPVGAGIGWHRDAPAFGSPIIGISLGSPCRMRFRRQRGAAYELYEQRLEPRSLYALSGASRAHWQHMILPTKAPRYSITFRTLVRPGAVAPGLG